MRPIIIQNDQDLWRAVQALGNDFPGARFHGWPVMRIRSSVPINGVKSALAVTKMQDAVHRLYGLLRYGTRNLRYLTDLDKAVTELGVTHHDGDRAIDIDFTNAMNACVRAVESWGEYGPYDRPRRGSIFAASAEEQGDGAESWERTARELGSQYIAKTPRRDMKTVGIVLGMTAIFAAAAAWTGDTWIKENSKETIRLAEIHYGHEAKLAGLGLERTTVKAKTAATREAPPEVVAAVERDLDADTRRVMALTDEIERPLLRFVMNEVEGTLPALMGMAPTLHEATYSVNGFEVPGRVAAAVGKKMRKQQNAAKKRVDTTSGWEPEIATDGWEPQIKKTTSVAS